jgi:[ribosomal protein S18]-alanine N-acetyltransferase
MKEQAMKKMLTRKMEPADVPAVANLERSIFGDPWPESAFTREIDEVRTSWPRVAVDPETGGIVAYLVGWFVADEAHLANLAVAPRSRRNGLAQQLVDELIEEGRRRDTRFIVLEVRRSNRAAKAFYGKNGFYPVTVRPRYYRDNGEDAIVMVKPLKDSGRIPPAEGIA